MAQIYCKLLLISYLVFIHLNQLDVIPILELEQRLDTWEPRLRKKILRGHSNRQSCKRKIEGESKFFNSLATLVLCYHTLHSWKMSNRCLISSKTFFYSWNFVINSITPLFSVQICDCPMWFWKCLKEPEYFYFWLIKYQILQKNISNTQYEIWIASLT